MINHLELGLLFIEDFLTIEEEIILLSWIGKSEKLTNQNPNIRNTIRRWGPKTPYHNANVSTEIPQPLKELAEKLVQNKILPSFPGSISINEYFPGNAMHPHIDDQNAGPIVTILSLGSLATMRFARKQISFDLILTARSIVQMKDEIRKKWTHEVLPVEKDRYSIVFRCI